jgi:hypothetical protein
MNKTNRELWYYAQAGRAAGPVHFSTLQSLAASGDLAHDDLCWCDTLQDWTPARNVRNLFLSSIQNQKSKIKNGLIPQSGSSADCHAASEHPA